MNPQIPDSVGPLPDASIAEDAGAVLCRFVTDAPMAVALFDTGMRYMAASNRWCEGSGVPREGVIGQLAYDVTPGAVRFRDVHERCLRGTTASSVAEVNLPTGDRIWAEWEMQPWRTRTGAVGGLFIRVNNITRQRDEHAALIERQRQLRIALDSSGAGTWTLNVITGELLWDQRSYEMFGIPVGTPVTLEQVLMLMPEVDRTRVAQSVAEIDRWSLERDWGEEFRVRHSDGTTRWIYARGGLQRNDAGEMVRLLGINLDVTARKRAELAAREYDDLARLGLEAASAFAWSWDADRPIIEVNAVVAKFLDLDEGDGVSVAEFMRRVHPDDRERVQSTMAAVRARNGLPGWEMEYRVGVAACSAVHLRQLKKGNLPHPKDVSRRYRRP